MQVCAGRPPRPQRSLCGPIHPACHTDRFHDAVAPTRDIHPVMGPSGVCARLIPVKSITQCCETPQEERAPELSTSPTRQGFSTALVRSSRTRRSRRASHPRAVCNSNHRMQVPQGSWIYKGGHWRSLWHHPHLCGRLCRHQRILAGLRLFHERVGVRLGMRVSL